MRWTLPLFAATALCAPPTAGACEAHLQTGQAFLRGETLRYAVHTVKIAGIPGLVRASGDLGLTLSASSGPTAQGVLQGNASAKAPLMKAYTIDLRLATQLDTALVHSRGFQQTQTTSNGGADDFDLLYTFDFGIQRWTDTTQTRKLPPRPQDMVSAIYFARALALADLECEMDSYFDRRQNPIRIQSRSAKTRTFEGVDRPTRAVTWALAEPRGSITGGTVHVTADAERLPVRLEIHFSFATIVMGLVSATTPPAPLPPAPPDTEPEPAPAQTIADQEAPASAEAQAPPPEARPADEQR